MCPDLRAGAGGLEQTGHNEHENSGAWLRLMAQVNSGSLPYLGIGNSLSYLSHQVIALVAVSAVHLGRADVV